MNGYLITMITDYPWFGWLLAVCAVAGLAYGSLWVAGLTAFASDWIAYRRAVLGYKTAVRRRLEAAPCAVCELAEEGTDPPEYQHDDGDEDWPPEPDEDAAVAFLAAVRSMGLLEDEETCFITRLDGHKEQCKFQPRGHPGGHEPEDWAVPGPPPGRPGPPVCDDPECDKYGWVHPPPCLILPTMPVPKYTAGPAMPPQPVRDFLHPAIRADLEAAGFSDHETNESALDSTFTRAQAMEVQARMRELER